MSEKTTGGEVTRSGATRSARLAVTVQELYTYLRYSSLLVALLLLWEGSVQVLDVHRVVLPAPSLVVHVLLEESSLFIYHSWVTLYEIAIGWVAGVALGFVSGVGIFYNGYLRRALYPLLTTISLVPKIAFAPLLIIWVGVGPASKAILALLTVFFPILVNTFVGLREIDDDLLNLATSFRVSEWFMFWKVRIPNAAPFVVTGVKLGVSYAVIGAVVAEFVAATQGLGYVILVATGEARTAEAFGGIFMTIVIGLLLYGIAHYFEHRLLFWHEDETEA